jgi:phage-related protein
VISIERIPNQFFKHLEDGIYEIRVKIRSDIFCIFCFFDEGRLVILLHAFQKKSQKTPRKEIQKAKRLRTKYYEDKDNQ